MTRNYLCIIPARGGSKGIRNKNIVKLKNKPLIQYTIDVAKKIKKHCEIVVSTDSIKISKIIKKNKLNFFGLRPKNLSGDFALTKDVVKFELNRVEKKLNKKFYAIILLQPTCPIRKINTIKKAILSLNQNLFDSVVSVSEVGSYHPYRMKIFKNDYLKNFMHFKNENMLPRQKLPKIYIRSGSFYLIKRDAFLKYDSLVGKK
jgi:CMP-N,N'-diacetyllegionaminic acid synthase